MTPVGENVGEGKLSPYRPAGDGEDLDDLRIRASAGDVDAREELGRATGPTGKKNAPKGGAQTQNINPDALSFKVNGKRVHAVSIRNWMHTAAKERLKVKLVDPKMVTKARPLYKEIKVRYQRDANNNPIKPWGEYDDFKRLVGKYITDVRDVNGNPLDLTGSKAYNH